MKITDEMIKRNNEIREELHKFCKEKNATKPDRGLDIGTILYFLGFKIIEQEMKNEKLEERIERLETKNYINRRLGGK